MTTIILTAEQRQKLKAEMDSQIEMLDDFEVEILASKLNDNINLPFISEGTEQIIFVKIVKKFDRLLYENLPNELYGLVKNASDGISDEDAEQLVSLLGDKLNKKFDIPYVPEIIEKGIFTLLIDITVSAMRKEFSIINASATSNQNALV